MVYVYPAAGIRSLPADSSPPDMSAECTGQQPMGVKYTKMADTIPHGIPHVGSPMRNPKSKVSSMHTIVLKYAHH